MVYMEQLVTQYGVMAVVAILVIGIFGLTIPIPDEVMMLIVGYFTQSEALDYVTAMILCIIGAIIGMFVSYIIGRAVGRPVIVRFGKWVGITEKRLQRIEGWIMKYGPLSIVVSYFIPGIRHITFYLCGITRMRWQTYLMYASMGAIIWCIIFISIGHFFFIF